MLFEGRTRVACFESAGERSTSVFLWGLIREASFKTETDLDTEQLLRAGGSRQGCFLVYWGFRFVASLTKSARFSCWLGALDTSESCNKMLDPTFPCSNFRVEVSIRSISNSLDLTFEAPSSLAVSIRDYKLSVPSSWCDVCTEIFPVFVRRWLSKSCLSGLLARRMSKHRRCCLAWSSWSWGRVRSRSVKLMLNDAYGLNSS